MDPVAAELINAAAKFSGTSASAVVSQLVRRHILADYAPESRSVDETAEAMAEIEIDHAAAHIDAERGYRAAG
ncbi:hypothetical protein [Nocardia sp. CDC160]|uniref:hypothetical protein n=1 Tax=Nocardia sp. CDC160 TaxID=3112166 RepID=UPI002DBF0956|nr:hypothetical protein [Nocardia sp. CDC160]MEC3918084.1 hypothetical protein [Nocardia sp. CDC160]